MSETPRNLAEFDVDVAVIGAGAAGLMTAIQAARAGHASATIQSGAHADTDSARTNTGLNQAPAALRVVALDGAPRIGIKILVAGGGRCNVTHHAVREHDYAGSTPAAIRRVLSRFTVDDCISFFKELGVELK